MRYALMAISGVWMFCADGYAQAADRDSLKGSLAAEKAVIAQWRDKNTELEKTLQALIEQAQNLKNRLDDWKKEAE